MDLSPETQFDLMLLIDETIKHLHDQPPGEVRDRLMSDWVTMREITVPTVRPVPAFTGKLMSSTEESDLP